MGFEERDINAARLCVGLANIGYKSYAAIEDIIDNSVAAGASNIKVVIDVHDNKTQTEKGSISRVRVIDDGNGMDNDVIRKALDIGSDVSYSKNSLSKYGLGLKSAGLSLGDRIQVYSIKDGSYSDCLTLDLDTIKNNEKYGVLVSTVTNNQKELFLNSISGTVIDISEVSNYDTVNTLKKRLLDRLGVIYFEYLNKFGAKGLAITLSIKGKEHEVTPNDIMHNDSSANRFVESDYDCKTPCKLLSDDELSLPNAPADVSPIRINLTVFPQQAMSSYPGFSKEEREKIKSYGVSLPNSGFFIYRNNRLIRWGDNLGIVDRDLRTLRGRIDITTEHDELLNVDVSKQNLELPDEFLDALSLKCRIPKEDANKAFKLCSAKIENSETNEGQSASESVIDIEEEDPNTYTEEDDPTETTRRRNELIKSNGIDNSDDGSGTNEVSIKKIAYKDYLSVPNLWEFRVDPDYGTVVQINKSHPFYQLVLKSLNSVDPKRQAIECFIYCLAVGEVKTKQNLKSVDYEDTKRVMERYNQVVSWNLQNWTAHNQDLFD
ncbi:ATP-binding protein [Vibrio sp. Isolate33]|uniref:ATP-binding protein n=1 Tax=Vibrio sp. Isolate33 TaxID=2908539 RepID=UPI001EFD9B1B|nr:ATP-binding protein [Vibrio sp. Isolate33]MCG9544139.1 ATP-binding protein [Vibrio sp. Isolate33]